MTTSLISAKMKTGALVAVNGAILLSTSVAPAQTDDSNPRPSAVKPAYEVRVNGRILTDSQLLQLEQIYHIRPVPGSYWYDALSGLYGVIGGPAAGLMYPGHKLGELAESASAGNMPVFINRRRIPQSEWFVWSAIVGTPVQPGRYWLDARGNVGYEGIPIPILNLRSLASANAGSGSGEHQSVLSSWDRTGTAVFGGVGVLTSGGTSWYPGQ